MTETVRVARVKEVIGVLGEMLELRERELARRHALQRMSDVVNARVAIWAVLEDFSSTGKGRVAAMCDVGWEGEEQQLTAVRPYVEFGCRADPSAQPLMGITTEAVFRRTDLISNQAWYESGFFADARRPADIDHLIHAVRPLNDNRVVGMTFMRAFGDKNFDGEDLALVELFHTQLLPTWERQVGLERIDTNLEMLSRRESQVCELLARGLSEKEAAVELNISVHTCHQYTKSVYRKLKVSNRAELARRWLSAPRRFEARDGSARAKLDSEL